LLGERPRAVCRQYGTGFPLGLDGKLATPVRMWFRCPRAVQADPARREFLGKLSNGFWHRCQPIGRLFGRWREAVPLQCQTSPKQCHEALMCRSCERIFAPPFARRFGRQAASVTWPASAKGCGTKGAGCIPSHTGKVGCNSHLARFGVSACNEAGCLSRDGVDPPSPRLWRDKPRHAIQRL
jgi:hypothetical protein